ncbi:MAG: glycosyltransferase [Planctomycetota bacterium]
MSDLPRVLLLTGSPPGEKGVGQIIVGEIYRNYPVDHLFCFAMLNRHESYEQPTEFSNATIEIARRRFEHQFRPFGRALEPLTSRISYWLNYRRNCASLTRDAVAFGKRHQCDLVFSILENASTIEITHAVSQQLGIPKHVLVWDAPDYIGSKPGSMPLNLSALEQAFGRAMSDADQLAVVSDPMARKYKNDFGLDSVLLRHVAAPPCHVAESTDVAKNSEDAPYVIGFAGSVTAKPQLEILQEALDETDWFLNGRHVRLDLYGLRFVLQARCKRNVRYCGYQSVDQTVASLSESADLLFMPQPFDSASQSFTELSFPTKLSTYLAVGRPILLLSPANSSLGEFFQQHPFGVWCKEMDRIRLAESLREISSNQSLANASSETIRSLIDEQFNHQFFRRQLTQFLNPTSERSSESLAEAT